MNQIDKAIEVDVPVRSAYNQWTQFEEFPLFMSGVKEVRQLDDTHLHWRAEIWGREKEWDAEITEQEPDTRISWQSMDGSWNAGTVRFEPLDEGHTRVRLAMGYEPKGVIENAGAAFGILSERVERTLQQFKTFIENRGGETGAWRGAVHDSKQQDRRAG